jgi:pyruvate/2-oxoglutarate dehydrogenase complex dihydrolipoamide acyltransferase (E2) component
MALVVVDRENVNDEFVVVRKIYRSDGEKVDVNELILDIETSKTVTEIRAPEAGVLFLSLCEGDEVAVGNPLFKIVGGKDAIEDKQAVTDHQPDEVDVQHGASVFGIKEELRLSRAAELLAKKLGVNIDLIHSRGWITASDIRAAGAGPGDFTESYCQLRLPDPAEYVTPAESSTAPAQHATHRVPYREERNSLRKRTEARNLSRANSNGTTSMIGIELPLPGPRMVPPPFLFQDSVADLVIFEASRLLRRYPELNAFYIDERTVGYYQEVNFGISFDSGQNLKVLALREADTLSLTQVQEGFARLLDQYESNGSLDQSVLMSSTVTLSDLSRSPANFMLPLLNADQSLILGITCRSPKAFELHASFDHRISEGLKVAHFLGELRDRVQSHYRIAMSTAMFSALRCSACDHGMNAELKMGGRGLLRIALPDGKDGFLCRNCFQGW